MPIISPIGRRHWRTRALIAAMYAALFTGAVTMIHPFLLMLAGSTKSAVDAPTHRVIPAFLHDRTALYQKFAEGLFNETLAHLHSSYAHTAPSFAHLASAEPAAPAWVAAWEAFVRDTPLPPSTYTLGHTRTPASRGAQPLLLRAWKQHLFTRYGGDLADVNRALQTTYASWYAVALTPEDYLVRRATITDTPFTREWNAFKEAQPVEHRVYFSVEGFYRNVFLMGRYTRDLASYNASHGTAYASWDEVRLDATHPSGPGRTEAERADWESFARVIVNHQWLRADPEAVPAYRAYLAARYTSLDALNRAHHTTHAAWHEIPLPDGASAEGLPLSDWDAFVQGWRNPADGAVHKLPLDQIRIDSLEQRFRTFLQAQFASIDALNRAWGTSFGDWSQVALPQQAFHARAFEQSRAEWRREFLTRNFVTVWDYLGRHGRGLLNTAIYCALAVLAALLVNPLAAYALSRYRPPFTYKVLLFLMLTMAFPPMVTQIPVFLLLRKFDLLNTFWALVLPGLANGYAIFLLKGFFDSLPRELYESAEMDGAGEFRIFWTITMSLSKPILAVIALNAFTHAYSNFMFALLICQDPKMWTLMPWLYQLQQYSGPGVVYASLLVAAIPTLVIFTLCQNVIMRGIVVPVEK